MTDEPVVVDNGDAGRFELWVEGQLAGFAEHHRRDGVLVITHTEIDPAFEGRGLGSVLTRSVLEGARRRGEPVLPLCPFTRAYIQRHPSFVELVPRSERAALGFDEVSDLED